MADKKKTRRWVIRAIVTFLAVMLLLTFFSNTIMNATIPKVVAEYAQWGTLSFTSSAKGTLDCSNKTEYKAPKSLEGRKVEKVLKESYDTTSKGEDVISLKEVEDTSTYDELVDSYDELKKTLYYDSKSPEKDSTKSFKDMVDTAQDNVDSANKKYAESKEKDSTIANAKSSLESKQTELTTIEAEIETASATVEEYETTIADLQSQLARVEKKIEEINNGTATTTPTAAPTAEPTTTPADGSTESSADPSATEGTTTTPTETELPDSLTELEAQKETLTNDIADAQAVLDDAKSRLTSASAKKTELNSDIADLQATITEADQLLDEDDAKKALDKANTSLTDAKKDLSDAQVSAGIDDEKAADKLEKDNKKLKDMEDKIAEMEEAMKTVAIQAPASGQIYEMALKDGDTIHEGDVLFSVMPMWEDIECTVEFSFPSDQAQGFYNGMELQCDSTWIDKVIIISIKPDKTDPRGTRIVKCQVEAETLYPGEEITVVAGQSNKQYENIVPSSAVIKDNTGYFVYALVEKSTPLGTKYTVKKIEVELEDPSATDGARTAIKAKGDGKLDSKYMYITRSEEPLKDGDRVRLQDYSKKE